MYKMHHILGPKLETNYSSVSGGNKLSSNKNTLIFPPHLLLTEDKLFLLGDTNSLSLVSSGLSVLSSGSEAPIMTKTTMSSDLLQTFQILSYLVVQDVGHDLVGLAIFVVPLPVKEPIGDLVLARILINIYKKKFKSLISKYLHDSNDLFNILLGQFSCSLGKRNISLLKDNVGVSPTNTLDRGQSEHDISFSINVGVKNTKNVLEVWRNNQRHFKAKSLSETVFVY